MDWAKTTARRNKKHLKFGIRCVIYLRFDGTLHITMTVRTIQPVLLITAQAIPVRSAVLFIGTKMSVVLDVCLVKIPVSILIISYCAIINRLLLINTRKVEMVCIIVLWNEIWGLSCWYDNISTSVNTSCPRKLWFVTKLGIDID